MASTLPVGLLSLKQSVIEDSVSPGREWRRKAVQALDSEVSALGDLQVSWDDSWVGKKTVKPQVNFLATKTMRFPGRGRLVN